MMKIASRNVYTHLTPLAGEFSANSYSAKYMPLVCYLTLFAAMRTTLALCSTFSAVVYAKCAINVIA